MVFYVRSGVVYLGCCVCKACAHLTCERSGILPGFRPTLIDTRLHIRNRGPCLLYLIMGNANSSGSQTITIFSLMALLDGSGRHSSGCSCIVSYLFKG
jgi:hypothetical protein